MQSLKSILLWNLMAAVLTISQAKSKNLNPSKSKSSGVKSDCAGNLMRLSLDKALALGNQLEVEAVNNTQHIQITPSLAAQCGYSMESDPWGNTRIYTSLLGCYVDNKDDTTFTVSLTLRMYSQASAEVASHDLSQTCSYSRWASKEILCDRNYMEVSQYMAAPDQHNDYQKPLMDLKEGSTTPGIWKLTFHTPGSVVSMVLGEAEQNGYGARITSKRLVVRSPYSTSETYQYPDGVAKIPMEMLKVNVYYNAPHGLSVMDMAAACPTGGVLFNEDVISWYVPRSITPLLDGGIKIIEMYMGINGQRLDESQMSARGYTLSQTEFHIIIEMRIGSPDGYYKSHALDYQYHITYTIEPMLEVLWKSLKTQEDTRYKVLFPITTPAMPGLNKVSKDAIPQDRVFNVQMWNFLYDVALANVTFSSGVFTVEECNAMGFSVQEHKFPNGTKGFSLKVPFDAAVVLKHNTEPLVTTYILSAVLGFIIMPEYTPFGQQVEMQVSLQDVVLPTVTGVCDQSQFHITVKYGNQGANSDAFVTIVGPRQISPEMAEAYKLQGNSTHFSFSVPYNSPDTAFEFLHPDSIRARLDVLLWNSHNDWVLGDLHLACTFPLVTTQCHPNGTMSALAVKIESTPNLVPSWLTLRDMSCDPVFSDDRFAYFSFGVDSCGTTRTLFNNGMLYENEIRINYHSKGRALSLANLEYKQTISCYYKIDQSQTVAFGYKKSNEPAAEIGKGHLIVQMRIAKDLSYESFYKAEDYPLAKYLKEPVYFEVELNSVDHHLELILLNCWATLDQNRTSLPSWDIIINGCEDSDDRYMTILHPVKNHDRAAVLSHAKRFSIKMFAFTHEEELLNHEIYIHCDTQICDKSSRKDLACSRWCAHPTRLRKPGRHQSSGSAHQTFVSSGPIRLNA